MAIANFIKTGTYSVIESFSYNKSIIKFELVVWDSPARNKILATLAYSEEIPKEAIIALSKRYAFPPPKFEDGDVYMVIDGDSEWSEYKNTLVKFSGGMWYTVVMEPERPVYVEDEGQMYFFIDGVFVPAEKTEKGRWFYFFDYNKLIKSNFFTPMYQYLLAKEEFHGCRAC